MTIALRDPALQLADRWQRNFPLTARPFKAIGSHECLSEGEVLGMLRELEERGALSRIGAVVRPNAAGASTLAAMAVPTERLGAVAETVSAERCVNHNYERAHSYNLWFVVTAPCESTLQETLQRIEAHTGLRVLDLRLERPYHIDLGFRLDDASEKAVAHQRSTRRASPVEKQLLAAMEDGLDIVSDPYGALAERLVWPRQQVCTAIEDMLSAGIISRIGCVLRHRKLGYTANAMAVFNVSDVHVDAIGARLAAMPHVTLCYRRNRVAPDWPYNLFAMIHGRDEVLVRHWLAEMVNALGIGDLPQDVLFSRQCFKQRGARFSRVQARLSA